MMRLIVQTQEPELRQLAASLLAAPCVECGHRAHVMLLLDAEPEPFVLCECCAVRLRVPTLELPGRMLAALARDDYADEVLFRLELARLWRDGKVPLERLDVFAPDCWARA